MPLSTNPFVGDDPASLAAMRVLYTTAISEITSTGQSYTINGRSFAFSDLEQLKTTLFQIKQAIAYSARGNVARRQAYPKFYRE